MRPYSTPTPPEIRPPCCGNFDRSVELFQKAPQRYAPAFCAQLWVHNHATFLLRRRCSATACLIHIVSCQRPVILQARLQRPPPLRVQYLGTVVGSTKRNHRIKTCLYGDLCSPPAAGTRTESRGSRRTQCPHTHGICYALLADHTRAGRPGGWYCSCLLSPPVKHRAHRRVSADK